MHGETIKYVLHQVGIFSFFGRFRNILRKATTSFVMSVRLSACNS